MWAPFRRLLLDLLATHATEQMQAFGDLAAIADNHRLQRLLHVPPPLAMLATLRRPVRTLTSDHNLGAAELQSE
jgi:hypothetical protein